MNEFSSVQKAPNLGEQLFGVYIEPKALFLKLRDAPRWGWSIITITLFGIALVWIWGLKVDVDALLRPTLEKNAQFSVDQIDQIIEAQKKILLPMGIAGATIMPIVMTTLMALFYWLVSLITSELNRPRYLQALSAATVPGLVMLPYSLAIILMCLLRGVGGLTPEKLSPFSLGFYIRPDNVKIYALFSQMDLFIAAYFIMVYLATRYILKLRSIGAWICTIAAILVNLFFKVFLVN